MTVAEWAGAPSHWPTKLQRGKSTAVPRTWEARLPLHAVAGRLWWCGSWPSQVRVSDTKVPAPSAAAWLPHPDSCTFHLATHPQRGRQHALSAYATATRELIRSTAPVASSTWSTGLRNLPAWVRNEQADELPKQSNAPLWVELVLYARQSIAKCQPLC